jgi:hypothetical protein
VAVRREIRNGPPVFSGNVILLKLEATCPSQFSGLTDDGQTNIPLGL